MRFFYCFYMDLDKSRIKMKSYKEYNKLTNDAEGGKNVQIKYYFIKINCCFYSSNRKK